MTPYTVGSVTAVVVAVVVDLFVLRTRLVTRSWFWLSYAIVLGFQFLINGLLTGLPVVTYNPDVILGVRLFYAPLEDVGFGFGLVLLTMSAWRRAGAGPTRSGRAPAAPPASGRPDRPSPER